VDRADRAAADADRVAVDRHAPGRGKERHHRRDLVRGDDPADGDRRGELPLDLGDGLPGPRRPSGQGLRRLLVRAENLVQVMRPGGIR